VLLRWLKKKRRERIRQRKFPSAWRKIVERRVPYYRKLPPEDRRELEELVLVFLAEKSFEGCGGLKITDEIRVTIAAQACILLLHRDTDFFPQMLSVVVYPTEFVAKVQHRLDGGVVIETDEDRIGESWEFGTVVLAWDEVALGAEDVGDGVNVVLHEFAHQLDAENGEEDGAPALESRAKYAAWTRVFTQEYEALIADTARRHRTLIDPYGTTSPAEFFAVVTETFFEKPKQLRAKHAGLYAELKEFYRQDPAELED
jgi:Mlc titration factor MtfA (ptsG expression regulator)